MKKEKGNVIALLPIGVFLILYLGLGILFEYIMKIPMGFYNVPIVVAFLTAILVACLQNRAVNFDRKLEIMAHGVGDKNIITMLLIFLAAGSFVGVVGRNSAESVAYFMLTLIPARFSVAVLFVVACFVSVAMGTSVGTITLLVPIAAAVSSASGFDLDITGLLLLVTILFGRHFCGYACAFGSLGDAMYELTVFIRQKVFHKKGRHGYLEKAVRILQKVKYILLAFLLLSILTGWYASLQGMSPWDVFSMLTARKLPNASYKIGIILLVLILIGMCTQERFFCQFLCPMGAVFAMMPILPSALFNRNREKCPSKCGLCRKRCPAHLEIDGDTPLSGECICCHACQVTCPRKNIQIGPVKEREMVKE